MPTKRASIHDKGVRLADSGAVRRVEDAESSFYVDGDHGRYLVTLMGAPVALHLPRDGRCEQVPTDPFASL